MDPVFSKRTVILLTLIGLVSFLAPFVPTLTTDGVSARNTAGANSFSLSAIGHHAFVSWMSELDIPIIRNLSPSPKGEDGGHLWVFAEPDVDTFDFRRIAALSPANQVLVVLPKWRGTPDREKPEWLAGAKPIPESQLAPLLEELELPSKLIHIIGATTWQTSTLGYRPMIDHPQLLPEDVGRPIVRSDSGVLLTQHRVRGRRIWVLSDPDLLNNHGIDQGDNVLLLNAILNVLRSHGGGVLVDEVIHGFRRDPNLARLLFRAPFLAPTLTVLAAAAIFLWAMAGRFGSPVPANPAVDRGDRALIDNTADLLVHGGYGKDILLGYLRVVVQRTAQALHAPGHLSGAALMDWLDRIGRGRDAGDSIARLAAEAHALDPERVRERSQLLRLAMKGHRWKRVMTRG